MVVYFEVKFYVFFDGYMWIECVGLKYYCDIMFSGVYFGYVMCFDFDFVIGGLFKFCDYLQ